MLGIIIPIDFHIFQRGRYTTNQIILMQFGGLHVQFQVHGLGGSEAETHPRTHEGEGAAWEASWWKVLFCDPLSSRNLWISNDIYGYLMISMDI